MDKQLIIEALQKLVTGISNQAEMHSLEAIIFADQQFLKLEEKYNTHATEERDFQKRFAQRILDLGGEVKVEEREAIDLVRDPVDFIKKDLEISKGAMDQLAQLVQASIADPASYDLLKEYYEDEEADLLWSQAELELIENIGKENWLLRQL
ncbi:MAG: ferritin-like domain-containing protein [Finegoldia sp.]|nr:ferritin-like domain-containing protein [Finegoldia sp.]